MRVKALLNLGTNDFPQFPLCDGEVAEVPDDVGAKLIGMGAAELIPDDPIVEQPKPTPTTEQAVAPKPPEPIKPISGLTQPTEAKPDRFAQERSKAALNTFSK